MNTRGKNTGYVVSYCDDNHRKHLTFVEGFSSVKFLEDRFENVYFEKTDMNFCDKRDEEFYYS